MKNTIRVFWLMALAGLLAIWPSTALGRTRGKLVFSGEPWSYVIGNDVKPGVDGLATSKDGSYVTSLVNLQQGEDGSATIIYIDFIQEKSVTKTVSTPTGTGRIILEPATPGSTTRQGVLITGPTFNRKTGRWTDVEPGQATRTPVAFVPDIDEPDPFPFKPGFNAPRELGSVWDFTTEGAEPDRLTKIDDHKWHLAGGEAVDLTSFDGKTVVWTYTYAPGPDYKATKIWTGQLSDDFKTMTGTLTTDITNGEISTHDSKKFTAIKTK